MEGELQVDVSQQLNGVLGGRVSGGGDESSRVVGRPSRAAAQIAAARGQGWLALQ